MTNKQKRHDEFREQLWLIMPHVEKVKYEWKPLQDWIDQQIAEERAEAAKRALNEAHALVEGLMFIYEHHFTGVEAVCENCRQVVKNNTPCSNSRYYTTWVELDKVEKHLIEEIAKLDQILSEYGKEQPHDPN